MRHRHSLNCSFFIFHFSSKYLYVNNNGFMNQKYWPRSKRFFISLSVNFFFTSSFNILKFKQYHSCMWMKMKANEWSKSSKVKSLRINVSFASTHFTVLNCSRSIQLNWKVSSLEICLKFAWIEAPVFISTRSICFLSLFLHQLTLWVFCKFDQRVKSKV